MIEILDHSRRGTFFFFIFSPIKVFAFISFTECDIEISYVALMITLLIEKKKNMIDIFVMSMTCDKKEICFVYNRQTYSLYIFVILRLEKRAHIRDVAQLRLERRHGRKPNYIT